MSPALFGYESSLSVAVILKGQIWVIMNQTHAFHFSISIQYWSWGESLLSCDNQMNYPVITGKQVLLSCDNALLSCYHVIMSISWRLHSANSAALSHHSGRQSMTQQPIFVTSSPLLSVGITLKSLDFTTKQQKICYKLFWYEMCTSPAATSNKWKKCTI